MWWSTSLTRRNALWPLLKGSSQQVINQSPIAQTNIKQRIELSAQLKTKTAVGEAPDSKCDQRLDVGTGRREATPLAASSGVEDDDGRGDPRRKRRPSSRVPSEADFNIPARDSRMMQLGKHD
eukprot:Selendium_serpulae@DN3498_c0_g1_i1.p1